MWKKVVNYCKVHVAPGFLNLRRPAVVAISENSEIKTPPTNTIAIRCKCVEVAAVVHQDGETASVAVPINMVELNFMSGSFSGWPT